ncbi:MAG: sulfite exporter TauE/SafE family protein [Candidatus Omnitrophota bacterium]|nr:sulfite exporter TauE/SafE family protein [Candidatus Omnitrophota bacterium]
MLKVSLSLFLSGLFLGSGPCLVSCGPFLVSFIAGNKKSIRQSLWIWFMFSLSRIFAYLVLGAIAGFLSQEVIHQTYYGIISKYIFLLGGMFVMVIGVLMIFNKNSQLKICNILQEKLLKKETKSITLFGLIIGFLPCAPLLGILTYIVLISANVLKGVFYSLSFGIGTLVSPLIIMVICASFISKLLGSQEKLYTIFQRICGLIILFLGAQLVYWGLLS